MKAKKCDDSPDAQKNVATTVKTEDGCEEVHVNMGTGQISYSPAEEGSCACEEKDKKK